MRLQIVLFVCILSGCGVQSLAPLEYAKWVEDEKNGLRIKRTCRELEFVLQYKPIDYILAQEVKSNQVDAATATQRKQELANSIQFNFVIRSLNPQQTPLQNSTDLNGYFNRITYFLSNGDQNFKIKIGNKILPCTLCHLEQNYGLAPENTLVLAFNHNDQNLNNELRQHGLAFMYEDEVFDVGLLSIKIDPEQFANIPQMNL